MGTKKVATKLATQNLQKNWVGFKDFSIILVNIIWNKKKLSLHRVGDQTAKPSKMSFCTQKCVHKCRNIGYINFHPSYLSAPHRSSSVFAKMCKNPEIHKKNLKWVILTGSTRKMDSRYTRWVQKMWQNTRLSKCVKQIGRGFKISLSYYLIG
jgi:hypothetical protein